MTLLRSRWVLIALGIFAMAWAIARAAVQSITIDEANSYLQFASRHLYLWYAANNHILNSALMYGFTRVLGLSQFTVRLPALLGAALYIAGCYRLCRLLGASLFAQSLVFVCLVFNPFVFDYLVAARGYGLAIGFLMWAIVYPLEQDLTAVSCAIASACAAMSVNANFSFAFVNLAAMTAILLCAWHKPRPAGRIRLLIACVLPGAIIFTIVSGYALSHTHSGELIYGATSLRETFGTIIEASLFHSPLDFLGPLVFPLVAITGAVWLLSSAANVPPLGWIAAAIFGITLAAHYVAFRTFGLLLPKDRTAIYFFALFIVVAGALAATPALTNGRRYVRAGFLASLAFMAVYFLSCLRLTYFKEWYWDADVQQTFSLLSCLNRENNVTRVASSWSYRGPLNFYRLARPNSIEEITDTSDAATQIYVNDTLHDSGRANPVFKTFYRSPMTDLSLEAPVEFADAYGSGRCFTK